VDPNAAWALLRRRWIPLVLCVIAGLAAAAATTAQTTRAYQATTSLIINIPDARTSQEALTGVQLSGQLLKSYAALATSRTAAARVKEELAASEPVDAFRGKLSALPAPETLLMTISATDGDPRRAELIADATAAVFIRAVADLERNKTAKVEPRVVDAAVAADAPVSPRPKVNLAIGLLLGLLTGAAVALLLEALDRTIKTAEQAEASFGAPVLASVPRFSAATPLATVSGLPTSAGEAYRGLRTGVQFVQPDRPLRTILVTSPSAGEGKTTTATNLAVALSEAGDRVVLVDADLRRGRVVDVMGLPGGVGVTSVIMRQVALEDALLGWREMLAVLGTGPLPPNPSEITGSDAMAQILDDLRRLADVVVIDCPPVLPVTDAVALSTQVEGVVLVARAGRTERRAAAEARQRLERVGANVVGCVLNGAAGTPAGYYAGYQPLSRPTPDSEPEDAAPAVVPDR
jgi:capsular exopolysaccharide synthesis family protein